MARTRKPSAPTVGTEEETPPEGATDTELDSELGPEDVEPAGDVAPPDEPPADTQRESQRPPPPAPPEPAAPEPKPAAKRRDLGGKYVTVANVSFDGRMIPPGVTLELDDENARHYLKGGGIEAAED